MHIEEKIEVEKFNRFAQSWWFKNGPLHTLHHVNPLRINFILTHVGSLANLNVLDVGCGGGILTESLAARGAHTTGIDLAKDLIEIAKLHATTSGLSIRYLCQPLKTLHAAENNCFDVVTCMELLEHVDDPERIISFCSSLTKPGGYVFFSTLNRNFKSYFFSIVMAEYLMNLIPKGTHTYSQYIKPIEIVNAAVKTGLSPIGITGVLYNPLLKNFFSARMLM